MFRLARHLGRTDAIPRVLRAQVSSCSRGVFCAVLNYRYASSSTPKRPQDLYSRLLASLRPGMKENELAMTIAALFLSTTNPTKLEMLPDELKPFIAQHNYDSLYKRVEQLLDNPPADNFQSILAKLPDVEPEVPTQQQETPASLPQNLLVAEDVTDDPSLPTPAEQLSVHLQTVETRRALELMEIGHLTELQEMMEQIFHPTTGEEDMEVLDRIAHFLSTHGIPLKYTRRLPPIQDEAANFIAEYEALLGEPLEQSPPPEVKPSTQIPQLQLASSVSDSSLSTDNEPPDEMTTFPDLMTPDALLDSREVTEFPPTKNNPYHNRVIIRNHYPIFQKYRDQHVLPNLEGNVDLSPTTTDLVDEAAEEEALPKVAVTYKFPLVNRRITQQTGKGKIHRQYVLMVVGNGNGLVGYGQGKDEDGPRASQKAYAQALRNMDWVERFEERTIWTDIDTKFGATRIMMRPRPLGFGLQCNPNLHQVFKAAGIKDMSAKVWGSRNPIHVIQAAFRVLHAGHAPLGMGDGIGGPAKKLNKGRGLRSKGDVERERGRQLISLRK